MPKRNIEEVICDVLTGNAQKNALDFVAYLRAHEIPIEKAETYWDIQYKGHTVCFLWVDGSCSLPGPWTIWSAQEPGTWATWPEKEHSGTHGEVPVDNHTQEVAWANVNFCTDCGGGCAPGKRKVILGRAFDTVCSSTMAFTNPDADALACAKKMVDIRKDDILRTA